MSFFCEPLEELTQLSNKALELIGNGALDEAEYIAEKLIKEYPELHDGLDRMAMIYEARKNYLKAKECYNKVIQVMQQNGGYEEEFIDIFVNKAKEMRLSSYSKNGER
jgi:tetratricopeptide (TPR) repeat protein